MIQTGHRQHWLIDVLSRAKTPGVAAFDIPADASLVDAWNSARDLLGTDLTLLVGKHFGLSIADLTGVDRDGRTPDRTRTAADSDQIRPAAAGS